MDIRPGFQDYGDQNLRPHGGVRGAMRNPHPPPWTVQEDAILKKQWRWRRAPQIAALGIIPNRSEDGIRKRAALLSLKKHLKKVQRPKSNPDPWAGYKSEMSSWPDDMPRFENYNPRLDLRAPGQRVRI